MTVKTGDSADIKTLAGLMLICGGIMIGTYEYKKKIEKSNCSLVVICKKKITDRKFHRKAERITLLYDCTVSALLIYN
ncbi:MAG: hypothetical protein ACLT8Y_02225 [Dorea formicigenerans]